ncbi:MAG TPA: hypothetical protein VFE35_01230 [Candidatus Cybelea sp.]|jgi:hypothetical protein|nr:hypothetical protein [Candidatus Cybelea sp.]
MQLLFALVMLAQSFFGGLPVDGIHCDREEGAIEHIHASLALYDRARPVTVPAGIGIPQGAGCLYWIHTHSGNGMIHIESPVKRSFTLGEFFDIWGPELSGTKAATVIAPRGHRLAIWVDGRPWHGQNPRAILLHDRQTIVIQNGPPFAKPPPPDWSKV